MIFIISLLLFMRNICALNCTVTQVHLAQGLDPTSMTISWVTNDHCFSHVAFGKHMSSLENIVHGSSTSYESFYKKADIQKYYKSGYIHHVVLRELEPLTTYYYECGDLFLNITSKMLTFQTLPKIGDIKNKLLFGVIGDIGQTVHSFSTINHLMKDQNINMILHAGDLSYADCEQPLWDSYGVMIEPLSSLLPWMVCPGNHEIEFNGTDYTNLFTAFEKRYRMPYIKPAEFGDVIIKSSINPNTGSPFCTPSIFQTEYNYGNSFYSFDNGLTHIIFLNPYTNTNITSIQYNWLQQNLALVNRAVTPWIIIVMHCPWYSSNTNHYADNQTIWMRESMEHLFYEYGVNIVFSGHVHNYERTYHVYKNEINDKGPVYITIGNAGNLEGLDNKYYEQPKWSAFRNGTEYGYGTLTILNEKKMFWRWYINDGKQMLPRDETIICNEMIGTSICLKE